MNLFIFFFSWFNSTNHKDMGSLYFFFAIFMAFVAFGYSASISYSLLWPVAFMDFANIYNNAVTLHAIFMIFFFVMPFSIGGLGNWLIPLFLGVMDMSLPSINNLSFWLLFFSFMMSLFHLFTYDGVFTGWTIYPPLSGPEGSITTAVDYMIFSLHLAGASSMLASMNFFMTIFFMFLNNSVFNFFKVPLFMIGQLVVAFLLVLSLPVLAAAMTMLLFDSNFNTCFFSNYWGGDAVLFQHLFWFFGHPEVYVLIMPTFIVLSHCICFLNNSYVPFGYSGMSFAIIGIGILGCIVWAHHMFSSGMDLDVRFYYSAATLMIAVPTGMKIFSWISSLMSSSVTFTPLIFWVYGFLFLFTVGGVTGMILSNSSLNLFFHDSYYVVAHFHYVLSLGAVFGIFLSFFFFFEKFFFFHFTYWVHSIFFFLIFISSNLIFFPLHYLGLWGLPSSYFTFDYNYYSLSFLSMIGLMIIYLSFFFLTKFHVLNYFEKWSYFNDLPFKYLVFSSSQDYLVVSFVDDF